MCQIIMCFWFLKISLYKRKVTTFSFFMLLSMASCTGFLLVSAVTNQHKLCSLAQIYSFGGQKSKLNVTRPKSSCWQAWFLVETLGESLFLVFPASRGFLYSLACGHINSYFQWQSLSLTLTLLTPFYKDFCNYIETTQIIQDNLFMSRSLIYTPLLILICHIREHIHRFWELGCRYF